MNSSEYNRSVDLYADNVYRFVFKNIQTHQPTQDVVQDAFERLWVNREEVSMIKVKSWLFTVAYRLMIDQIRKEGKHLSYEPERDYRNTGCEYLGLNELLEEALNTLPLIQKQVVMLRDYEGYNYAEIGEITALTESQVKVYIFRARKSLRKYIGQLENVI